MQCDDEVSVSRSQDALRYGIRYQPGLKVLDVLGESIRAGDARSVDKCLVLTVGAAQRQHDIMSIGWEMDMQAIPAEWEVVKAIADEVTLGGDGCPGAVIEGWRGESRRVGRREEPDRGKVDALAVGGGVDIAGIGKRLRLSGAEHAEHRHQHKHEQRVGARHTDTISVRLRLSRGLAGGG
jgi:hypothetical protein